MVDRKVTLAGDGERRGNMQQGWVQSDKDAHTTMWQLGVKHPSALAVLHFMVSRMKRGTNGVVMSATTLASQMGLSIRTVQGTIAILRESRFVQVLKSGNTNVYIINSRVAWQGERGFRYASFNAHITLEEAEQDKDVDQLIAEADELIDVPVMEFSDSVIVPEIETEIKAPKKTKKVPQQDLLL